MRLTSVIVGTAFLFAGAGLARAQEANDQLSALQIAVACAPPPVYSAPPAAGARHVIGAQDTVPRSVYNQLDTLVIDGGSADGLAIGQRYFLRRAGGNVTTDQHVPHGVQTAGWIRIVAVNTSTAIAAVEHACGPIFQGDVLAAFTPPALPADIDRDDTTGEPDFARPAHVLYGSHDRQTAGIGEFMLVEGGAHDELAAGRHVAFYRDVTPWWGRDEPAAVTGRMPVSSVAEGVVVESGPSLTLVRITSARDAVATGDLVVPRK